MAAAHGPDPSRPPVVVLLLGEKLSGKSSAGNTILGKRVFRNKTTRSSKESGSIFGKQVTVVDTPGWLSHSTTPDSVSQELCRGLLLCQPELHAILLVLPTTTTFGQVEWEAMQAQLTLLQTPIWQRAMLLFTHGDKLGRLPIQEYIEQQGQTLRWLLERCGNRYQVMTSQPRASEAQVAELFEKIQEMMEASSRLKKMMYTQLRPEVSIEGRWGRQPETDMTVMHDGRQRKQMFTGRLNMSRGFPAGPVVLDLDFALILLGRRKSGKSSAGNTILGREEFQTDTKTIRSSAGRGKISRWSVTVVDTPGWSLFGLASGQQVRGAISQSVSLCPATSKVSFLLAVPVDSFREKDRRAVETYVSVLGNDVWRSTVVLFTYGEELRGKTVEKHIEEKGKSLQWVLDRCGRRHHVFHTGDKTEVIQLLETLEKL